MTELIWGIAIGYSELIWGIAIGYSELIWGIAIGYWLAPTIERIWIRLNQKLDEWANIS